ncbi:hypothetical protein [Actinoplanes sp. NPDC051859]|uniref:hypothetical protein n=1 Tax=Actinoplanes sp. NPDC051859 TaxID=3363909 RepID=UPI0037A00604
MNSDVMVGFGGKQAWLAVRDGDPERIIAALGLRDLGAVPWRDGIDLSYLTDDRVIVTPPLPDARGTRWVLAAGRYLMRPTTVLDLPDLSRRLGTEVQFFATHRVTEAHRWQRADDGALVRAFGYVGQTGAVTTWFGDPDPAERAAGLPPAYEAEGALDESMLGALDDELELLLRGEAVGGADSSTGTVLVSEQDVLSVAGGWSIDPTGLDGRAAPGPLRVGAAT